MRVHVGTRVGHQVAGRPVGEGPTGIVGPGYRGGVITCIYNLNSYPN